jgi:serine kinase of HPr protein (carbohydrate metabolism regulator)
MNMEIITVAGKTKYDPKTEIKYFGKEEKEYLEMLKQKKIESIKDDMIRRKKIRYDQKLKELLY